MVYDGAMFGLGVGELVLLIAVVALVGGPAAVMSIAKLLKTAHKAKSELTGQAILGRMLEDPPPPKRKKRRKKKKRPRSSST